MSPHSSRWGTSYKYIQEVQRTHFSITREWKKKNFTRQVKLSLRLSKSNYVYLCLINSRNFWAKLNKALLQHVIFVEKPDGEVVGLPPTTITDFFSGATVMNLIKHQTDGQLFHTDSSCNILGAGSDRVLTCIKLYKTRKRKLKYQVLYKGFDLV